ncbi:hypothetical protein, partial [Paenarthrobacter aurescens]|uniref:hypothetical protein n=1 Tax=Paenarthrobacter aurescens TaxID=43663 RepID=UPI0021C19C79
KFILEKYILFPKSEYPLYKNKSELDQKTGENPNIEPSGLKTIGTKNWTDLLIVRRIPSTSPVRPSGEAL